MMSTRGRRKRDGSAPRGLWFEGKIKILYVVRCEKQTPYADKTSRIQNMFNVTVQPSGRAFTANPDEALLAAAIRQGIGLPYGCKDGACGSCK